MKLETERLVLRDIEEKDRKDMIDNINNINVSKYLLVVPCPYTDADADWWANHCAEEIAKNPRENYGFVIELKTEGKAIGGIGLTKVNLFLKRRNYARIWRSIAVWIQKEWFGLLKGWKNC